MTGRGNVSFKYEDTMVSNLPALSSFFSSSFPPQLIDGFFQKYSTQIPLSRFKKKPQVIPDIGRKRDLENL